MSRTFRMTAVAAVAAFALSMPAFAAQAKPAAKTAKAAKTMTVSGTSVETTVFDQPKMAASPTAMATTEPSVRMIAPKARHER